VRSRAGYWIGGALVAAGVAGAILWLVFSLLAIGDEVDGFQRASVPGDAIVELEAREYVVYYEGSLVGGVVPPFGIELADAATGASVPVSPYKGSLTYSVSGRDGTAVATFTAPRAGTYAVRTDGEPGPVGADVAIGRSLAWPLVRGILGAVAIGLVVVGAGVTLIVVTAIRRSRLNRPPVALGDGDGNTGPLGEPRGIGFGILLYVLTFGIYGLYWVFKTQEETKQHTGEGIGGVLGLVVWLLLTPVSAFVIPSEIGNMYRSDGQEPPLTGWTGLWLFPGAILVIPAIVWFVVVQRALNRYWEAKALWMGDAP
jgi:hypothetical protein